MAMKFQLPDGKNADILALSTEGFPERTHEGFRNLKLSRDSVPKEGVWWSRKNLNPRRQAEPRSDYPELAVTRALAGGLPSAQ